MNPNVPLDPSNHSTEPFTHLTFQFVAFAYLFYCLMCPIKFQQKRRGVSCVLHTDYYPPIITVLSFFSDLLLINFNSYIHLFLACFL